MAKAKVDEPHKTDKKKYFDSDQSDSGTDDDPGSSSGEEADNDQDSQDGNKSGMASVVARILSKDISKSNRVLLAKGKTNKEILKDISERKRQREEAESGETGSKSKALKVDNKRSNYFKEEKRKIWESMGRKMPSVLDNPKEMRLRKIATQGMVQLFRSVNEHQKLIKGKLASVGSSERKRDKVMAEFTKGKFLDLLKGKKVPEKSSGKDTDGRWKILKDDYMMGASMKDWDKSNDGDSGDDYNDVGNGWEESMEADDVMSDDD